MKGQRCPPLLPTWAPIPDPSHHLELRDRGALWEVPALSFYPGLALGTSPAGPLYLVEADKGLAGAKLVGALGALEHGCEVALH